MYHKNHSKEAVKNIILKSNKKYYYDFINIVTGKKYLGIYLIQKFCEKHNLNYQGLYWSVRNNKNYKGWKIFRRKINP